MMAPPRPCELLLLLVLITGGIRGSHGMENSTAVTEPPLPATTIASDCEDGECEKKWSILTIAIIAGVAGLVVLIVATILICACVKRRKRKLKISKNVKPIKCTPRQSVEEGKEAGEQPEEDTYLIVLPNEDLPCSTSTSNVNTPPTTDTIYVNVPKEGQHSPRLPAKTPPARQRFTFNEVQKGSDPEEVARTDSIYVNVPHDMSVSPRSSNHPSPPMDDDDNNDDDGDDNSNESGSDADEYDYPGVPYAKPMKEAKAKATSPKHQADAQQTHSRQRGRAPALPSPSQDIYSPVYEERNMARGVNFPSSPKIGSPRSPKVTTDHVYGNVPFTKGSRSPSAPDMQKMMQHRLSPPGYLPMTGSEGRLTSFQFARDSAQDDELYVNGDPQIYVNA